MFEFFNAILLIKITVYIMKWKEYVMNKPTLSDFLEI